MEQLINEQTNPLLLRKNLNPSPLASSITLFGIKADVPTKTNNISVTLTHTLSVFDSFNTKMITNMH